MVSLDLFLFYEFGLTSLTNVHPGLPGEKFFAAARPTRPARAVAGGRRAGGQTRVKPAVAGVGAW